MLWKLTLEMDTTEKLEFLPPHPKVCMHFRGPYTPRARTMPDPEMAAVLTQNGVVKGSIYADTEKASDDASATGFVILASEKGEKFQIICPMAGQGAFYSTRLNGKTSFTGYRIA